jgi:hypothetical protein
MGKDLFDSHLSHPLQKWLPLRVLTDGSSAACGFRSDAKLEPERFKNEINLKKRLD